MRICRVDPNPNNTSSSRGYGVATALSMIPLTPGGLGAFELTMLIILALLRVGSEGAIPILGYRLFNFWLPITLAAIFYPMLRLGAGRERVTRRT
jgi:glycosyltransferase 2 family protein